jgi:tRNA (guanine-N7-)-methyltransferase
MSRLRKAGRILSRAGANETAARVFVVAEPGYFAIDLPAIFGRIAPVEIEIGAGKGEFIIARAEQFPDRDFLAIELSGVIARVLAVRGGSSAARNLRVARMDARSLVHLMLSDASVAAYHVYFPDPWPKERHLKHRLITPRFCAGLMRTLAPGAAVYMASDVEAYSRAMFRAMKSAGFIRAAEHPPGASQTGFARKYLKAGKPVYGATFRKPAN